MRRVNCFRHLFLPAVLAGVLWLLPFAVHAQTTNTFFQQGLTNYAKSEWPAAITNFTHAIQDGDHLYESYGDRAYAEANSGDTNAALADCNQQVKLSPDYSGAYYWRARVELIFTNTDQALADFRLGLKTNPRNRPDDVAEDLSVRLYQRAFARYTNEDFAGAIAGLDQVAGLTTNFPGHLWLRAWIHILQNKDDAALADATQVIKWNPQYTSGYELRAWARFGRGDAAGARDDVLRVTGMWVESIREKPVDNLVFYRPDFELTLGLQAYLNQDYPKAADAWNNQLVLLPQCPAPFRKFIQSWIEKAQAQQQRPH